MTTIEIISVVMIFIGAFFILTAALGTYRFNDLYTRLHAASKASTFGFAFIVFGSVLPAGDMMDYTKAIVAIIFQFTITPVIAHMIARVAMRRGIVPHRDAKGNAMRTNEIP